MLTIGVVLYKYQNVAWGVEQWGLMSERGVANASHIPYLNSFPTGSNKCPGHKYVTSESYSYVRYAQGIRSEFHIGMLVEKSTFL